MAIQWSLFNGNYCSRLLRSPSSGWGALDPLAVPYFQASMLSRENRSLKVPKEEFWMVWLHTVPLSWSWPSPAAFPRVPWGLRSSIHVQHAAATLSPAALCSGCSHLQPQGCWFPRHSHIPECQLAGIVSSLFSTHVGFMSFPSQMGNACTALQQWWKWCPLFSSSSTEGFHRKLHVSVRHGLEYQHVSHRSNCSMAVSQERACSHKGFP